jgi:hypothetical protein
METNRPTKFINKKVTYTRKVIQTQLTTKELNHEIIEYNNNKYIVCLTTYLNTFKLFLIDFEDKDKVIYKSWHFM